MNAYYLMVALFSIAAALLVSAEQQQDCQCVEGSQVSLELHKNDSLSNGECGQLTLGSCSLTILCNATSPLLLATDKTLAITCSNNGTAKLDTLNNRSVNIILECSDNNDAHLENGTLEGLVLKIRQICKNNSNETSPATTQSTPPQTTNEVQTTGNNITAGPGTSSKPTVTSEYPSYSNNSDITGSPNSSDYTTEEVPSGNFSTTTTITTQEPGTTTDYAVSLRICSGLLVMTLAVSSLL